MTPKPMIRKGNSLGIAKADAAFQCGDRAARASFSGLEASRGVGGVKVFRTVHCLRTDARILNPLNGEPGKIRSYLNMTTDYSRARSFSG